MDCSEWYENKSSNELKLWPVHFFSGDLIGTEEDAVGGDYFHCFHIQVWNFPVRAIPKGQVTIVEHQDKAILPHIWRYYFYFWFYKYKAGITFGSNEYFFFSLFFLIFSVVTLNSFKISEDFCHMLESIILVVRISHVSVSF